MRNPHCDLDAVAKDIEKNGDYWHDDPVDCEAAARTLDRIALILCLAALLGIVCGWFD